MDAFIIRVTGPEDLEELLQIEHLSFPTCWMEDFLKREFDPSIIRAWCARSVNESRQMVGYLSAIRVFDELHLLQLAAHPKYRRMGVGTKLLNHALEKEQRLNHVLLEVRETNKAAIAFYKKMGFYKVGRRRRYYADTGEDALVLAKELE
jgi:ribosomal-protein-alanine N-acetyltransferase